MFIVPGIHAWKTRRHNCSIDFCPTCLDKEISVGNCRWAPSLSRSVGPPPLILAPVASVNTLPHNCPYFHFNKVVKQWFTMKGFTLLGYFCLFYFDSF